MLMVLFLVQTDIRYFYFGFNRTTLLASVMLFHSSNGHNVFCLSMAPTWLKCLYSVAGLMVCFMVCCSLFALFLLLLFRPCTFDIQVTISSTREFHWLYEMWHIFCDTIILATCVHLLHSVSLYVVPILWMKNNKINMVDHLNLHQF